MAKRDQLDLDHMRLLLRFSLPPNANCIDIGANRGDILREILTLAPDGEHLAFEPLPERAADLRTEFQALVDLGGQTRHLGPLEARLASRSGK
jgi:hypothetical protein